METISAADYRASQGSRSKGTKAATKAPQATPVPASAVASVVAPVSAEAESPYCQGFGVATRQDSPGSRFVAWGAPAACVAELVEVARRHGLEPSHTAKFIQSSQTH